MQASPNPLNRSSLPACLIPDRVCPSARLGDDAKARTDARVNGAATRAESNLDDVVATIAPRMIADALARSLPRNLCEPLNLSVRTCVSCGCLTEGSTGVAGIRWSILCQPCKDAEDAALDRRLRDTAQVIKVMERKVRPVFVFDFDAPQCKCGCREFIEVAATESEADTGFPGNKRGLDCKDCGEFYERE